MSALIFPIEPTILKLARKTSGYPLEEVSVKTKIKLDQLKLYEEEKSKIPFSQIDKLAALYKRPLAFFLLDKIPEDVELPKDFRYVFAADYLADFSPKAYLAIRRARYAQAIINELKEDEFNYKFPIATLNDDPEVIADKFRDYIKINFDQQKKWSSPSEALKNWKIALENISIFVMQFSLPQDNVSAFCLADASPFVIIINSSEHEYRRIFSLFHEVGHILLRKSGICTPDDLSRNSYEYAQIEMFCNKFAGALLLPKTEFIASFKNSKLFGIDSKLWEYDDIKEVSNRFRVSKEAFLRRLLTLSYIDEDLYKAWRKNWQKSEKEFVKPKKKIIIPQYIKCISQNGHAFTTLVLNQYHNNRIGFNNAADILNIAPKHISALEYKIW